jgi:hypothetical protein
VIYDTVEENQRRGHFERIFPTVERCKQFLPLFIATRFNDVLLHRLVSDKKIWQHSPLGAPFGVGASTQPSNLSSSQENRSEYSGVSDSGSTRASSVNSSGSRASSAARRRSSLATTRSTVSNDSNQSSYIQARQQASIPTKLATEQQQSLQQQFDNMRLTNNNKPRPSAPGSSSELRQTLSMKVSSPLPPEERNSFTVVMNGRSEKQLVPTSVFKMQAIRSQSFREKKEEDMEIKRLEVVIRQSEILRTDRSHLKLVTPPFFFSLFSSCCSFLN